MSLKIEVLVSTMNRKQFSLIKKMNLLTDSVIINQTNSKKMEYYVEKREEGNLHRIYNVNDIGIGKSRNLALNNAEGDICILTDDDVEFVNDYEKKILKAYELNPDADLILFNVPSKNSKRPTVSINKNHKINYFNFMKYGAVNCTFKKLSIQNKKIEFSLLFGGGAKYSSGEDTLFLKDCLSKKLKIVAVTDIIAEVEQKESTWFNGYNEKYFFDKGVFFRKLNPKLSLALCLQFAIRKHSLYKKEISFVEALKFMRIGMKNGNK